MDLLFGLLIFTILYFVIKSNSYPLYSRCDQKNELHQWIQAGNGDETYTVCQKCRFLPNGLREEKIDEKMQEM